MRITANMIFFFVIALIGFWVIYSLAFQGSQSSASALGDDAACGFKCQIINIGSGG